jgi:hypothetical protein
MTDRNRTRYVRPRRKLSRRARTARPDDAFPRGVSERSANVRKDWTTDVMSAHKYLL